MILMMMHACHLPKALAAWPDVLFMQFCETAAVGSSILHTRKLRYRDGSNI